MGDARTLSEIHPCLVRIVCDDCEGRAGQYRTATLIADYGFDPQTTLPDVRAEIVERAGCEKIKARGSYHT